MIEFTSTETQYRDTQVKGRVVTTMEPVTKQIGYGFPRPAFEVRQVIDGVVVRTQTFDTRLAAAEEYVMLRAHARRNLHEYLSSMQPEIGLYLDSQTRGVRDQREGN
jgi:hypothetical protein